MYIGTRMESMKQDWESVYASKTPEQMSWTQRVPQTSLDFIQSFNLPKSASIIDIGGGDSRLVDVLVENGFSHITVLDISSKAIERAKARLGSKKDNVKWIVSDINDFMPSDKYDIWHDRATFHFLTTPSQVSHYMATVRKAVTGFLTIATFSDNGPGKCSGLEVKQYSEASLTRELEDGFRKIKCITEDHITPFNTRQNFLCCSFRRAEA